VRRTARKARTLALSRLGLDDVEDSAAAVEKALREIDLAHDQEVERQREADNDTLDKALSVLDGLQSTGHRVGIISHVSALKEWIGVRVHVSPIRNGRSRVRVMAG